MSERDRLMRRISDMRSIERGLTDNISADHARLSRAQREYADAGRHFDALLRQQAAQRQISQCQSSISSNERELGRVRNQIRGLELEVRSLR